MVDVLRAEQDHLRASREALQRMQDEVIDIAEIRVAGLHDHYSAQVLKQHFYRRKKALHDDPTIPLFFGRLDYAETMGAELDETLYIGRRHVTGELGGQPLVVDWRAPMSLPFYRASAIEPMGCRLRRRFGFQHCQLTAYEDEHLDGKSTDDEGSAILQAEIEKPRTGPMRDIVATIQPEQDVLVRADLADSLCIQGAPGTGKTAVGLHRAAYLLYAFGDQLKRQGIMVIGPNDSFLSYIGDVLPALGEIDATQETLESLVCRAHGMTVTATEPAHVAMLKADARLAEVIARAVWSHVLAPWQTLVVPRGSRVWRVPADQVREAIQGIRARGVRYDAGRQLLPQQLAHLILVRMEAAGDSPDDRVQNAVARSKEVKQTCAALWPELKPIQIIFRLLSDPSFLAEHAEGILSPEEQASLLWPKPPRSAKTAKWTLADAVLIDEASDVLTRQTSLGHIIVDEAQDHSPMALRAIGRRASTGSLTLLGDLAQATTPWASRDWSMALDHLGKPETIVYELTAGFRVPAEVIDYAAQLLPTIAPGLAKPHSVRHARGELDLRHVDAPMAGLADAVLRLREREGTVGVIVPDALIPQAHATLATAGIDITLLGEDSAFESPVDLVHASLAKGLEFDHVLVVEPNAIVAGEADTMTGLRRLYVCLTRAVTSLIVLTSTPMPALLRG